MVNSGEKERLQLQNFVLTGRPKGAGIHRMHITFEVGAGLGIPSYFCAGGGGGYYSADQLNYMKHQFFI